MKSANRHSTEGDEFSMAYQTINPSTEELVKTFKEHTEAQLEAIIGKAEETYENDLRVSLQRCN